jgi:hypothetical protein
MDLQLVDKHLEKIEKVEFHEKGLVIHSLTFDEWENLGLSLRRMEKGIQFWLGDWLNYGENKWGEKYSQAVDQTDYEYQTLADFKYVAGKIQFSFRNEKLSFTHHRQVAALEPAEQKKWLDIAEKESLNVHHLRNKIRKEKADGSAPEPSQWPKPDPDDILAYINKRIDELMSYRKTAPNVSYSISTLDALRKKFWGY